MFVQNTQYEILTPSGWKDFLGVSQVESKKTFRICLSNETYIEATAGHYFFKNNVKIKLGDLVVGDLIDSQFGPCEIIDIIELAPTTVYDIVEVSDENHQFYVNNGIISKNCDELAFVQPRIATEFWTSISPTLSTGGKTIVTSTPNQDDDQFAILWKQACKTVDEFGNEKLTGVNNFRSYKTHWRDHPDRDDDWAADQRSKIGEERFRREMELEFIAFDETLIDSIFLSEMHEGEAPYKKTGQVRWYAPILKNKIYVIGLDPSLGTGGDPAAIQVFSLPDLKQVAEWQHNKTPIPGQVKTLREICTLIHEETNGEVEIYWSVENNTLGEAALVTIQEMGEENIPGIFLKEPKKMRKGITNRKGFTTTHPNKLAACAKLKQWVEKSRLKISSKNLIRELKTFVARGTSYKAKEGETDDLVMALILVIRMIQVVSKYDEETFEQIREAFEDEISLPMPIGFL